MCAQLSNPMGWLIFIFLLYFLCLLVERALVGVSSHDLDILRAEESRSARQALSISLDVRSTLAALLLARVLLLSTAGVGLVGEIRGWQMLHDWLGQVSMWLHWPPDLIFFLFYALFLLALAAVFTILQKLDFRKKKEGRAISILKRLWWVAQFWKILFKLFIPGAKLNNTSRGNAASEAGSAAGSSAASEKRELELLKSIVQFGDVTVKQVMQPRSKVVSVNFKTDFHDLLGIVRQSEFSRLPVYDEELDNVTGILYVKDLLPHLDKGNSFEWQPLIRTNILLVPEAKRGSELLQEFKQQRMHMAFAVDEYGSIAGIVTMEDILEEVIGDIRDEFDEESEIRYRKIDEFNYLFEGQTLLNDVCRICGLAPGTFDAVRGTTDTLAGLALELRGDIPLAGAELHWKGFSFAITSANRRRIEQVKLSLPK